MRGRAEVKSPGPAVASCPAEAVGLVERVALRLVGVEARPGDRSRLSWRHDLKPRGAGEGAGL